MELVLEIVLANAGYFFVDKTLKSLMMLNNLILLRLLISQEMEIHFSYPFVDLLCFV